MIVRNISAKSFVATSILGLLTMTPVQADQQITVAAKTPVPLVSDSVLLATVAVNPGDELDFHVATPVVVGGYVVIPADAKAIGHFVSGGGMKMGLLGGRVNPMYFSLDYVISADGKKIKLDGTQQSPPVMHEVRGPSFLVHKSMEPELLNKGTKVNAAVDHTIHVDAKEKASSSGGYDN